MRLASYRTTAGDRGVGVFEGEQIRELAAAPPGIGLSPMRQLIARGLPDARSLTELPGRLLSPDEVEWEPVVPDPSKIIAAPVNYRDHQAEMQEAFHVSSLGVFLKAPSSVLASGGVVQLPYVDRRFDQEGEVALIIGRTASHVPVEAALDYVAGYTLLLDMTMRGGEDRSTRKSFDTFTPVGPVLVTPDEVGDPADLRLRTWVNGELRQDADVRDLIWDIPQLIAYASSVMVLQPGDIITTGTPAGIGQVVDGDTIAVESGPLGRLEVDVSATGAVPCPTSGADRGPRPPETVTPVRTR